MNLDDHRIPRAFLPFGAVLVMALAVALASCGKDNPQQPDPGSSMFRGAFTGAATGGCLSIIIATATPAPQVGNRARAAVGATGTIRLYGSRVDVTGTYDDAADTVALSGGGWTIAGNLTTFGMEGTFTGPQGNGVFSLLTQGSADTIVVFTGTFESNSGGDPGNFNFAIRGTGIRGHAVDTTGVVIVMEGTFTRSDSTMSILHPITPAGPPFATGRWQADNSARGTYDDQAGDSGTWVTFKFN